MNLKKTDDESVWLWRTRVTAEAAQIALLNGKTPRERFELYEQLVAAALEALRLQTKDDAPFADNAEFDFEKALFDYIESSQKHLSDFDIPNRDSTRRSDHA